MGGEDNKLFPRIGSNRQPRPDYICSMEVNGELVDKLAHLSRLKFNAEEKQKILIDLQRMISFVEKLSELDTTGVEPLRHLQTGSNTMREDITGGTLSREEALRNSSVHDDTYFKVPKVIRK